MDVARLNFSHGSQAEHAAVIAALRAISRARRPPLRDPPGPGRLQNPHRRVRGRPDSSLAPGDALHADDARRGGRRAGGVGQLSGAAAQRPHRRPAAPLRRRSRALRRRRRRRPTSAAASCAGAALSSHKGISLPTGSVAAAGLTARDREDLAFGIAQGVDYVALSFVRSADDVRAARAFIAERGAAIPIVAKIEKHEAPRGHRRDPRRSRRPDGRARRPRRRDAARTRPAAPEDAHREGQPRRQARDHGDADAAFDGGEPPADAGGGRRRRQRDPRRHRRGDALGRDGVRPATLSRRWPPCGASPKTRRRRSRSSFGCAASRTEALQSLPEAVAGAAVRARRARRRLGDRRLDGVGRDGASGRASTARAARSSRSRPFPRPRGASPWSGASSPSSPRPAPSTDAMLAAAPGIAVAAGLLRSGEKAVITAGHPDGRRRAARTSSRPPSRRDGPPAPGAAPPQPDATTSLMPRSSSCSASSAC